jgi:hypothetical protein
MPPWARESILKVIIVLVANVRQLHVDRQREEDM